MLLANIRRGLNLFITDLGMNLSMTRVLFQGSLHNRRFMSQARQTRHFARFTRNAAFASFGSEALIQGGDPYDAEIVL